MRAYRKRPWSSLMVNMTPLIDVVFLIIIFFIIMINFSDLLLREVALPRADESRELRDNRETEICITVKSERYIFLGRKRVSIEGLEDDLSRKVLNPGKTTVRLRGDEDLPYDVIQKVMERVALTGVTRIEFSTRKEPVTPLEKDVNDEDSP